jgi:hypothetical protein
MLVRRGRRRHKQEKKNTPASTALFLRIPSNYLQQGMLYAFTLKEFLPTTNKEIFITNNRTHTPYLLERLGAPPGLKQKIVKER